jgi:predicted AlkP superfamily pyrophosphatase or phosphodiesterase
LLEFTPPRAEKSQNDRKVILLLFDALREDFVALPKGTHQYLSDERTGAYKGRKIQMFKEALETHPEQALLFPLTSEMPTVTTVRIKGMLSGGITNFFETSEEFGSSEVKEDNVLAQLRARKGKRNDIVFYGDYIWSPMFGKYFDRHQEYESLNVRDLDSLDKNVANDIYKELDSGSNFSLMLAHIIGVDSAGHTYSS